MKKLINLVSTFKKLDAPAEGKPLKIVGFASTAAVDRAGDTILASAWTQGLENYTKNPIILFNHDYDDPIGKCTSIRIVPNGLEIEAEISPSAEVYNFIQEGILKTFSVGFAINDAEWDDMNHGLRITSAELYEISVVSVPCNQDAVFSVSKSFDNKDDFTAYVTKLTGHSLANKEVKASTLASDTLKGAAAPMERTKMDPEELKALVEKAAKDAAEAANKARDVLEAKKLEEATARAEAATAAAKAAEDVKTAISSGLTTGAERLYADLSEKLAARDADAGAILEAKMNEIKEAAAELTKMHDSKRHFGDRSNPADWKTDKAFGQEVENAFLLGLGTRKGFEGTELGKQVMTKVNTMSGVQVSSADFEQLVSTSIERDIQNELILAPMFREIALSSATQILPIAPDSGYAQITSAQTASGSSPNGNLAERGDTFGAPYGGMTLQELTLSTVKIISQSYLGNETEEDAILPILPLIRDGIIRSHARSVEQAFLLGNHADGVYTSGAFNGLVKIAATNSKNVQSATAFASESLTGAQLLNARKQMGKYGLKPQDVVYIVSQRSYFELLQDSAFQDWTQVQNSAMKLTGEVGMIYGSKVMLCDEFAAPAISKHYALAVNPRNFLVPRLRGMRMESQYTATAQSTVVIGSQRIGFSELIAAAPAVVTLQYKAS
jgi:HK97 family phage prohead protease